MIHLQEFIISEMANDFKHFRKKIEGISKQLIPHICICIYCELYDNDNRDFEHWKDEVNGWLKEFVKENLKNKSDKFKLTKRILIENNYNSKDNIISIINKKFLKDNINTSKDTIDIISDIFISNIDNFIEFLRKLNLYNIDNEFDKFLEMITKYKNEEY